MGMPNIGPFCVAQASSQPEGLGVPGLVHGDPGLQKQVFWYSFFLKKKKKKELHGLLRPRLRSLIE